MATVTIDNIDGLEFAETKDGLRITRPAKVTGLVKSGGIAAVGEAFAALTSAGYTVGSSVSVSALGVSANLVERTVKAISQNAVEVALKYTTDDVPKGGDKTDPTLPVYKVSARLVQKNVGFDRTGAQITVSDPTEKGRDDQHPTVTVLVPQATISISRVEEGLTTLDAVFAILGKLNSTTWNGPAGRWLCTGVDAQSTDGGEQWQMEWEFQADSELQWQPMAAFTEADGSFAPGITEANGGIQLVDWYDTLDFNTFNF